MSAGPLTSKTYSPADFREPRTAKQAARLRRFALRLGLGGTPFAVNGILRRRFWVRRNKLWEYARGLACLETQLPLESEEKNTNAEAQRDAEKKTALRVLDFGGAATLPVLYLAAQGCEVLCLDIDERLSAYTNQLAAQRRWNLRASTHNIVTTAPLAEWDNFDAVISCSVLEHIPKREQAPLVTKLAALLKPGGVFALTFDFGEDAPQPGAVRTLDEVTALVAASGLSYADGAPLRDTGERFVLDKRYPDKRFTFASVLLLKTVGRLES
jgi:SAM-dependent methyltransferase